eukprot:s50_g34.t1
MRQVLEPFLLKRTMQLHHCLYLLWDWCFDPITAEECSICAGHGRILSLLETYDLDYTGFDTFPSTAIHIAISLRHISKHSHPYCNLVRMTE